MIYLDTGHDIHLQAPGFNRQIVVSKQNSHSTVTWNPWLEKSKAMDDMTENGWSSMICIESANVVDNSVRIKPGHVHQLATTIAVQAL